MICTSLLFLKRGMPDSGLSKFGNILPLSANPRKEETGWG